MAFKIKIKEDERVLYKAQFDELDDFNKPFNDLKKKFKGFKHNG